MHLDPGDDNLPFTRDDIDIDTTDPTGKVVRKLLTLGERLETRCGRSRAMVVMSTAQDRLRPVHPSGGERMRRGLDAAYQGRRSSRRSVPEHDTS
jgi:hypothetical protein